MIEAAFTYIEGISPGWCGMLLAVGLGLLAEIHLHEAIRAKREE